MLYDHLQQKSNEQRCRVEKPIFAPWKINMEPKNGGWKMMFLFNWVIFRFHVNFQGVQKSKAMDFCSLQKGLKSQVVMKMFLTSRSF